MAKSTPLEASRNHNPKPGWTPTGTFWFRVALVIAFVGGGIYLIASYGAGSTWNYTLNQVVEWMAGFFKLASLHPHPYVCYESNGLSKALPEGFVWIARNVAMWVVELLTIIMVTPAIICAVFWVRKSYWRAANEVLGVLLTTYFVVASIGILLIYIFGLIEKSQCPKF